MLNKKSQVEDWLPLLFIIIVLVFVFLFISIGNFNERRSSEERVSSEIAVKDSGQLLLNYLKSPLILDGSPSSNIADKLNQYFLTGDEDLLNQIITSKNEFFLDRDFESYFSSWALEIKHPDKRILIIESERSKIRQIKREQISRIILPTPNNDKFIEIKLFKVIS